MERVSATEFCDRLKFNRFHWNLLILGILTLIFDGYDSQFLPYVMPNIMKEWHLSPVAAGSVMSYGLVGLMIGTAGLGMLADRIGRRYALMLGLSIFSLFSGGLYWIHGFKMFCIFRFLAGLGLGGAMTLNITLASEFAPSKLRATMVTAMMSGFMLGPAVAGFISMVFIPSYGWRVVLLFALLPLLFLPFLYFLLPESVRFLAEKRRYDEAIGVLRRMEKAAHVEPSPWNEESFALPSIQRKVSVKNLFSSKLAAMTIVVWLLYFVSFLSTYGLVAWMPTLLIKAGLSSIRSYGYTALSNIGGALGAVLLGMVLDRFGRKAGLVSAYVLAAIVSWLFGQAVGHIIGLYVLAILLGFLMAGGQTAQHAVTGEIYPTFMRSTGVGWALSMGRFGAIFGPLLGGMVQAAGLSFSQYFTLLAIPSLVCAVLVLFYRVNVKGEALETVEEELTGAAR